MDGLEKILELLPVLIPIVILELLLMVIAIVDLFKNEKIKNNQKIFWLLIIILIQIIGPVVYLVVGNLQKKGADD